LRTARRCPPVVCQVRSIGRAVNASDQLAVLAVTKVRVEEEGVSRDGVVARVDESDLVEGDLVGDALALERDGVEVRPGAEVVPRVETPAHPLDRPSVNVVTSAFRHVRLRPRKLRVLAVGQLWSPGREGGLLDHFEVVLGRDGDLLNLVSLVLGDEFVVRERSLLRVVKVIGGPFTWIGVGVVDREGERHQVQVLAAPRALDSVVDQDGRLTLGANEARRCGLVVVEAGAVHCAAEGLLGDRLHLWLVQDQVDHELESAHLVPFTRTRVEELVGQEDDLHLRSRSVERTHLVFDETGCLEGTKSNVDLGVSSRCRSRPSQIGKGFRFVRQIELLTGNIVVHDAAPDPARAGDRCGCQAVAAKEFLDGINIRRRKWSRGQHSAIAEVKGS